MNRRNHEADLKRSEPLRSKLMKLYEQWDEVVAVLRRQATADGVNIWHKMVQARQEFDALRNVILYGDRRIAQLETYFTEYVAELRKSVKDGSETLVIVQARRDCDEMIKTLRGGL